jgi:hydrogenase expression/formation protein HypC
MCLAIPGKIVSIMDEQVEPAFRRGKVDFGGIKKEISLAFTPEAEIGNYVLVHVGFALSVVDEDEAQKIFEDLKQMQELEELNEGVES